MKKLYVNLFLGLAVLGLGTVAGSAELRQVLFNKTVFGHFQPRPAVVDAINAPASISFDQRGTVRQVFDDWNRVKLTIKNETVEVPTEFSISRPQELSYRVYAKDGSGRTPTFKKPVEMRIMVPFPKNLSEYGMYRLASDGINWIRISNVGFYSYTSEVVFDIYEPGVYRLMNPKLNTTVVKRPPYADGTLLRGPDYKIYVIYGGNKYHIRSLLELSLRYPRQAIINVPQNVIEAYH